MSTNVVLLPILIPMLTGVFLLFFRKDTRMQRRASLFSSFFMLLASIYLFHRIYVRGILVFCAGGWDAPYGISLVMDLFSGIMVAMGALLSFTGILFALQTVHAEKESHGFYILWQFLMMGINGAFVTGDLFNLFVFFEIMLISSYAILAIGNSRAQLRESFKYMMINILSSAVFLIALGSLYSMVGTLNMADIAQKIAQVENQGAITMLAMIFFIVFGVKGAMFPLFFWLPQVHTIAEASVSSIFSGLLIKVGIYAMVRSFTLIFVGNVEYTHLIIAIIAVITMVLGVFGAVSQMNYKTILAYHSVSQIGYIVAGLGLFTVNSIAGTVYFIVHHGIVKGCLFLTAGVAEKITGSKDLKEMGGLLGKYPGLGWIFFLAAMSLAGVPPLSGFFGKFALISSAAEVKNYGMIAFAMGVGVLTLFSMAKIFLYAYWHEAPREYVPQEGFHYRRALLPCAILAGATFAMGIFAGPILDVCTQAATQMMNPTEYITTVLSTVGGR